MNNESIGNITTVNLTDWDKVSALTDRQIIHDEDSPATAMTDWSETFVSHSNAELHAKTTARKRAANKPTTQKQLAIRLDVEIVNYFRATGKGWQTRMNDALKEWVREHPV